MKSSILRLLQSEDKYISGEQISKRLDVSRTAVWKNIEKLRHEGYVIESSTNKGYRLVQSPDNLTKEELSPLLHTEYMGRNVYHYGEIDSTNLQAKRLAGENAPNGSIVFADSQTGGRGRLGRQWDSPQRDGVWMTALLYPDMTPDKIVCITLVAGYSVCRAIRSLGIDARIKWPNDIVINGKKVCGILTEMTAEAESITSVVVGIGINVNNDGFPGELGKKACSLYMQSGKKYLRKEIAAAVIDCFEQDYSEFCQNGFAGLCEKYNELCANVGKQVMVSSAAGEFIGEALRVLKNGALLVETEQGEREISYGEVSVRGILGYV